jgi:hypothetical protein
MVGESRTIVIPVKLQSQAQHTLEIVIYGLWYVVCCLPLDTRPVTRSEVKYPSVNLYLTVEATVLPGQSRPWQPRMRADGALRNNAKYISMPMHNANVE